MHDAQGPLRQPRSVWDRLLKRIGRDGALQLGPDVSRITRGSGGDHDAADGAIRDVAGHLVELVVTDGRHVVIDHARSHCRCRSDRLHHGVLVGGDGVVTPQVGETECGPVLQGLVTLMRSDIDIAEVVPGRVEEDKRQRARITMDATEPRW